MPREGGDLFRMCVELGKRGQGISCRLGTPCGDVTAGLHPVAGGTGVEACSGDMLMEALVACASQSICAWLSPASAR